MSPILVRPVREQFEHDRVIRVLQARYKRKYEVVINPGAEQNASVGVGDIVMYPDLVLFSQERGRKLQATIEVETTESINTLEAMAEWGPFSRLRAQFFLFVPPNALDTARRLCAEHHVEPAEIWTYHTAVDQVRFTMVHRAPEAASTKGKPADRVFEKPNHIEKVNHVEKAERGDKIDKPDVTEKIDRTDKPEPPAKAEKKAEKAMKAEKLANTDKPAAKAEKSATSRKPTKPEKAKRVKKAAVAARKAPARAAKPARKVAKPARASKPVKKTAAKKSAKAKRR